MALNLPLTAREGEKKGVGQVRRAESPLLHVCLTLHDKDRALDECDIALAGVDEERAGDIMQVLYRELDSGDAND